MISHHNILENKPINSALGVAVICFRGLNIKKYWNISNTDLLIKWVQHSIQNSNCLISIILFSWL